MPTYEVEQYELHAMTYRIEAETAAQAIAKLFHGEAEAVGQSQEFIEVADDYGLPVVEFYELARALRDLGINVGENIISSIRSITEV